MLFLGVSYAGAPVARLASDAELHERRAWFERLKQLHANHKETGEKFPSAEEMIREDRER